MNTPSPQPPSAAPATGTAADPAAPVRPADRMPPLPESSWTEAQRREALEIIRGPRGALISPFVPLLRSPELMAHAQRMGEYLRYRSALPLRLSELAIVLTARHWSQPVEWAIHAPIAQKAGIAPATLDAIAEGRDPLQLPLPPDEAVLVAFSLELLHHRSISDPTWAAAIDAFGEQGVMDLLGIHGYYGLLSMVMNAARTTVPPSTARPLPPLPGV